MLRPLTRMIIEIYLFDEQGADDADDGACDNSRDQERGEVIYDYFCLQNEHCYADLGDIVRYCADDAYDGGAEDADVL